MSRLGPCSGGGFTEKEALPAALGTDSLRPRPCPWSRSGRLPLTRSLFTDHLPPSSALPMAGQNRTFFFPTASTIGERERESTARIRAQREGDRSLAPWSWIKMERWIRMWLGAVVSLQLNIIGPRTSSQSWAERKNPTRWNFRPLGYYFDVFVCVFRVQSRVCVKSNIHLGTFAPINQQAPRLPLQPTDDDARSRIAHPSSCETALFIGSPYSSSYSVSSMGPGLGRIQFPATHHGPASLSPVEVRAVVTIHRQLLVHGTIRR